MKISSPPHISEAYSLLEEGEWKEELIYLNILVTVKNFKVVKDI
jgi:hypothetical protein